MERTLSSSKGLSKGSPKSKTIGDRFAIFLDRYSNSNLIRFIPARSPQKQQKSLIPSDDDSERECFFCSVTFSSIHLQASIET
jgi:hypothetical protein